jgi:taurine dioxygenase
MTAIQVRPLSATVGAEITGLVPDTAFDPATIAVLRDVFDEHSVLVFRDLDVDGEFQRALLYALVREELPSVIDPSLHTTQHISNKVEMSAAPYGRLLFHCDNMFAKELQPAISLYGVTVEPPVASTSFVSMGAAWESLPADLRARVDGLEARHGFDHGYPNRGGDDDVIDIWFAEPLYSVRPIAFRHPRTGRTLLYVAQQCTIEILGLTPDENEALLAEVFAHLYEPTHVVEHEWREDDLVVWDNVAVQHARSTVALDGPERTLRKITGPLNLDANEIRALTHAYSKVDDAPRVLTNEVG